MLMLAVGAVTFLHLLVPSSTKRQPSSPSTRGFVEGTEFILERPYRYVIGSTRTGITIPTGFVTDFASIPAPLRGVFAKQARYSRAALVHDYLYWAQGCSRKQSDNLFMIAMKESGVGQTTRDAVYNGVRVGASLAWTSNAKSRHGGSLRVVPRRMFYLADHKTWPQARRILISKGVRDPGFSIDPAACRLGNSTRVP